MLTPLEFCTKHNACAEGGAFAARYATMAEVWDACPRLDWLCWMYERAGVPQDTKALRLFACWCVRETPLADGRKLWDLLTDPRSRAAVEAAERYAQGLATDAELRGARIAADADAAAAAADAAAYAAARKKARDAQVAQWRAMIPNPFSSCSDSVPV